MLPVPSRSLCVAPMMDWTDRHCRAFHRILAPGALLYSEMVTAQALTYGDPQRLLYHLPLEDPVALQVGGSDPDMLARAARLGEQHGFAEINLNLGCPSDRVQQGGIGAVLMKEPATVAEAFSAMVDAVSLPVTAKLRIGVDEFDSADYLADFIGTVGAVGCRVFIIHARKAWLSGLSPRQNREIPPLDYGRVLAMQARFPDYTFVLNGGIETLEQGTQWLTRFPGIMLGRAAYHHPFVLTELQKQIDPLADAPASRLEALERFLPYIDQELARGTSLSLMVRPLIGLFRGCTGGKIWRRHISENACRPGVGAELLMQQLPNSQE